MKINDITKSIKPILIKNEPEILMGIGIGGLIFSTIWGIKATFKASKKIQTLKQELQRDLTKKEMFNSIWMYYIPVVISSGLAIPSIIIGNRVSARRNAALAAAYAISETALFEYKEQTLKTIGEKKEQEIREKIAEKRVTDTYAQKDILLTGGDGDCLFFEPISGRYFKSTWNKLLKAANELNANSISSLNGIITLTEWFDEIGLPSTKMSNNLCWNLADGRDGIIDIGITAILTPDDKPCGSISYNILPKAY